MAESDAGRHLRAASALPFEVIWVGPGVGIIGIHVLKEGLGELGLQRIHQRLAEYERIVIWEKCA